MRRGLRIAKIVGMIVMGFIAVTAFTLATMYLWNWLVPDLFGGKIISFWQALGLLALSKILFSGFGKGRGHGGHWNARWRSRWQERWQEKWNTMTPEQREKFKAKMKDKWCMPIQEEPAPKSGDSHV